MLDKGAFFVYNNSENTSHRIGGIRMSIRECAVSVLASLSEEKMQEFIMLFADKATIAKMQTELMINDPTAPRFKNVDDLFKELDSE